MAAIMIVDDSRFIRAAIARILKSGGYETFEAENGQMALDLISAKSPDCMLLDLLMPVMDGIETLKSLKEKGSTVPVIVLTADIQQSVRDDCFKLGVVDFLNKPPNEDDLLAAVEKALPSKERPNL